LFGHSGDAPAFGESGPIQIVNLDLYGSIVICGEIHEVACAAVLQPFSEQQLKQFLALAMLGVVLPGDLFDSLQFRYLLRCRKSCLIQHSVVLHLKILGQGNGDDANQD
jgi:hypothetical protein